MTPLIFFVNRVAFSLSFALWTRPLKVTLPSLTMTSNAAPFDVGIIGKLAAHLVINPVVFGMRRFGTRRLREEQWCYQKDKSDAA